MGKYGSDVSMISMMLMEMMEIEGILSLSNLSEKDKQGIKDAYKEICYQWCQTNAAACMTEEDITQMLNSENCLKFQNMLLKLLLGFFVQKMKETYPWGGDEDLDDLLEDNEDPDDLPEELEDYDD